MVSPRGSNVAKAAFTEGYKKRRTDEHASYASLKGSGTGNAVPYVAASLNKEILIQ
jgi:hypothetical protein